MPTSVLLHLWSMKLLVRSGTRTGGQSSNTFCVTLADHKRHDATLPHWPAAARWWHSRLKLIGPHKEKKELLFFPVSETTGLHQVHPTWAGTFVLAALVAVFPGLNFVLLDSDCLPVTLFEVEDLWTEAFLARFPVHSDVGIPKEHPLHACQR